MILLFEIEPGGVEFQLEIECFTLEFQMKKPRSHTNLEQEKQQSIIKSNPDKKNKQLEEKHRDGGNQTQKRNA